MKPVVIFGCGEIAQLAHYYFTSDSNRTVAAFTVDAAYLPADATFCGLQVVAWEAVAGKYPPDDYDVFVALSYAQLNRLRSSKVREAEERGYGLASYCSSRATILTQFPIGENAFILENNTVQPFVRIGKNVTLWSGNHIGHHSVIEDDCFITSHAVVSGGVRIGARSFVGVNATLRDHINLGPDSVIGAGAIILADVAAESVFRQAATPVSPVPSSRLRKF